MIAVECKVPRVVKGLVSYDHDGKSNLHISEVAAGSEKDRLAFRMLIGKMRGILGAFDQAPITASFSIEVNRDGVKSSGGVAVWDANILDSTKAAVLELEMLAWNCRLAHRDCTLTLTYSLTRAVAHAA